MSTHAQPLDECSALRFVKQQYIENNAASGMFLLFYSPHPNASSVTDYIHGVTSSIPLFPLPWQHGVLLWDSAIIAKYGLL